MAQQLLVCGADPLVQCLHTRLIKPSSAHGTKGINNWRAVPWRTTVLHMLLGESAGLLLGPVPWRGYVELQQLCLQMAIQLAASDKVEALLDARVNEDGEDILAIWGYPCPDTRTLWGWLFDKALLVYQLKHGIVLH